MAGTPPATTSYQAAAGPNRKVPLYEGGVRVWGEEPGPATPDTTPPTAPGTPTASAVGPTGLTLAWGPATDNVGVTGYRVYRSGNVLVGSTTGTTLTVTGLTASTTYTFTVVAVDAAGNVSAASAPVTVTTADPPATGACTVGYVTSTWDTGFTANIAVTNTGTSTINGWTLAFTFTSTGQKVGQGWSANFTQTGTAVTASNVSYNGTLAPGASTSFGFNGTHTGTNPRPTTFTLNGVPCAVS